MITLCAVGSAENQLTAFCRRLMLHNGRTKRNLCESVNKLERR